MDRTGQDWKLQTGRDRTRIAWQNTEQGDRGEKDRSSQKRTRDTRKDTAKKGKTGQDMANKIRHDKTRQEKR